MLVVFVSTWTPCNCVVTVMAARLRWDEADGVNRLSSAGRISWHSPTSLAPSSPSGHQPGNRGHLQVTSPIFSHSWGTLTSCHRGCVCVCSHVCDVLSGDSHHVASHHIWPALYLCHWSCAALFCTSMQRPLRRVGGDSLQ